MPVKFRDAGNALRSAAALKFRDTANTLRTASVIKFRDAGNVLRTVYTAMTVGLSSSTASKTVGTAGGGPVTVTSPSVTASPIGGTAPYTYAWTRISGDASISASVPTGVSTAFSALVALETLVEAIFQVVVTDASGAAASATVNVSLYHVDTR